MQWARALLIVAFVGLGGCAGKAPPDLGPIPELDFGPMTLETVPLEPWEARGVIQVTWTDGLFAVWTKGEDGMPAMAVRDGETMYTSDVGMGWTRWDVGDYVQEQGRGFRYLVWDVRSLLQGATLTAAGDGEFEARASFQARGDRHEATITVQHAGAVPTSVRIATPADAESPYTLTPTTAALPFPARLPSSWVASADVGALEGTASEQHGQVLGWIDDHVATLGRVPTTVTPDSLAVQRLNEPWPTNPFDDQPLRDASESGHFSWKACGQQDALYQGYGLDKEILGKSYGRGCTV